MGKPVHSSRKLLTLFSPHAFLALGFALTSNLHLVPLPMTTAALHYMYKFNHFKKLTLYYDLENLGKNENYLATFDQVKHVLMTDERLDKFID